MKSRLYKPIVFIAAAILLSTNCEGPEEPEEVTEDTFMNQWTKHPDNPVLAPGTSGDWDDERVGSSNVLQDGTTYRMWYAGYDGAVYRIGYATSLDRINWTKDATNPVLDVGPAGSWDDVWIGGHNTLFDGTTYHMWYSGNDSSNWRIGYATSPDGVNWTKYATNPVLDLGSAGSWDDTTVYVPSVILDGSTFHMWYNGYDGAVYRIGYATSPDGINWTKDATNPVLDVGPAGSWDDLSVSTPFVRSYGDTYQMWYTGNDGADQRIGYATSPDGVDWTKDATNPVLDVGPAGSWDDSDVFIPWVIDDGSTFHMWYTGNDGTNLLRIGYATDTSRVVGIEDYSSITPSSFVLYQNYPNPFNPVSTIRYDLPKGSVVSLIVYDILGREVVRLVDSYMEPGYHRIQWNGGDQTSSHVPSGIYIARLVTPEYSKSIKMVLLK